MVNNAEIVYVARCSVWLQGHCLVVAEMFWVVDRRIVSVIFWSLDVDLVTVSIVVLEILITHLILSLIT